MSNLKLILTSREYAVLNLVAQGKRNKEIAGELCISENTVESHIKQIYKKMGVRNRSEAVNHFVSSKLEITEIRD